MRNQAHGPGRGQNSLWDDTSAGGSQRSGSGVVTVKMCRRPPVVYSRSRRHPLSSATPPPPPPSTNGTRSSSSRLLPQPRTSRNISISFFQKNRRPKGLFCGREEVSFFGRRESAPQTCLNAPRRSTGSVSALLKDCTPFPWLTLPPAETSRSCTSPSHRTTSSSGDPSDDGEAFSRGAEVAPPLQGKSPRPHCYPAWYHRSTLGLAFRTGLSRPTSWGRVGRSRARGRER